MYQWIIGLVLLYGQPYVVVPCKVDGKLNVPDSTRVDDECWEGIEFAIRQRRFCVGCWNGTGVIERPLCERHHWIFFARW